MTQPPYIIWIAKFCVRTLFSLVDKQIVDYSQNLVDKVLNIKTSRLILYFFAFWFYFANNILDVKGFEIIREGMLTWIILDTIFFGTFTLFEDKRNKKINRERLELHRVLIKFFDDSILEKNKFQIASQFFEMEKKEEIKQYFEAYKERTKINKKNKNIEEYYSDFFYMYSWFKNQSIMSSKEYKKTIISLKSILASKEIQILCS